MIIADRRRHSQLTERPHKTPNNVDSHIWMPEIEAQLAPHSAGLKYIPAARSTRKYRLWYYFFHSIVCAGKTIMCFCERVSFTVGSFLIAGGAFAGWKAIKINKRYFPVSQMPTLAGLQQFTEGHVWMGLNNSDPSMIWWAAMGFIFFSWLIWPVWIPFSIYFLEPPASRRKLPLMGFALAGLAFGLILFVPHLFHPDWVTVKINRQSLAYEDTMFLDYLIPRWLTYAIYVFLLIMPSMISTYLHIRLFGLTLIAVLVVVYAFLTFAYISFFCFLAGLGTVHLIYIIARNKCCRECPELFG